MIGPFQLSRAGYAPGTKVKIDSLHLQTSPFWKHKLLAGNDHVIDIFTSEDSENISLCIFNVLLSTMQGALKTLPRNILKYSLCFQAQLILDPWGFKIASTRIPA